MSTAKLELARATTTTTTKIRLGSAVLLLPSGSSSSLASSGAQEPFLPFPPRRQSIAGSCGMSLISASVNRGSSSTAHEPSPPSSRRREHQRRSWSTNAPFPLAAPGGATSPVGSLSTGPDRSQDTAVTGSSSRSSARPKLAQMQTIDSLHMRAEGPERTVRRASFAWPHGEDDTAISNDGAGGAAVRRLTEALREREILVRTLRSPASVSRLPALLAWATDLPLSPESPTSALPSSPTHSTLAFPSSSSSMLTTKPAIDALLVLVPLDEVPEAVSERLVRESGHTRSIHFDLFGGKEASKTIATPALETACHALAELRLASKVLAERKRKVVLVAYSTSDLELPDGVTKRCLDAGANLVLTSPYKLDSLYEVLASLPSASPPPASDTTPSNPPSSHCSFPSSTLTFLSVSRPSSPPFSTPASPALKFDDLGDDDRSACEAASTALTSTTSYSSPWPPAAQHDRDPKECVRKVFAVWSDKEQRMAPIKARRASLAARDSAPPFSSEADSKRRRCRRASVDTGGIARAFALESVPSSPFRPSLGEKEAQAVVDDDATDLAELLSELHVQTQIALNIGNDPSFHPSTEPARARELLDLCSHWKFAPHTLSPPDQAACVSLLFRAALASEGLWELDISLDRIDSFLLAVRAAYHAPNPYHNYIHAVDVLQATYQFLVALRLVPNFEEMGRLVLETGGRRPNAPWKRPVEPKNRARDLLRPQDVLALLVAAIGHDVAHPGLSNVFMKNAQTPLSKVYSDISTLENLHCHLLTALLRRHSLGFLLPFSCRQMPSPPWADFRRVLVEAVLATDMARHFSWIAKMGPLIERFVEYEGLKEPTQDEDDEDRTMLCQALIKCADISNPTRPHEISKHWSSVLLREWTEQADLELGLQLPVSVIRWAGGPLQAKGQVGFIDLFVQPLFDAVADVMPQLQPYATHCMQNRAAWSTILEAYNAEAATSAVPQPTTAAPLPTDIISMLNIPPTKEAQPALSARSGIFPLALPKSESGSAARRIPDNSWQWARQAGIEGRRLPAEAELVRRASTGTCRRH